MFNPNEHLMKLKGKDYLQVAWRLVWLREVHPEFGINTELVHYDAESKHAIFKATITDKDGRLLSSGYGSESVCDFGDFIEKAETKAVGRALAMLGYGTQFVGDELDEGGRIVDSPIDRKPNKTATPTATPTATQTQATDKEELELAKLVNEFAKISGLTTEVINDTLKRRIGKSHDSSSHADYINYLKKIIKEAKSK